ncbi:MAG: hypothetical protein HQK51_12005 [Oligoflexia bacterium]|nr:hypothetical protein [Oligoflexia bacterium]
MIYEENKKEVTSTIIKREKIDGKTKKISVTIECTYFWINDLMYNDHLLNYLELIESQDNKVIHKFAYLSSIGIDYQNICEVAENGRIRFIIENEGFNTQKNSGYGLTHKFSRTSMNAVKNYYTCIQIGHLINQLFELRQDVKSLIVGRQTMRGLWRFIVSYFCFNDLCETLEEILTDKREQIRLVG